jgi:hypothetical protein
MSSAKHGRSRFHVQKSDVIVWLGGEFAAINAAPIVSKGDNEIRDLVARQETARRDCLR